MPIFNLGITRVCCALKKKYIFYIFSIFEKFLKALTSPKTINIFLKFIENIKLIFDEDFKGTVINY